MNATDSLQTDCLPKGFRARPDKYSDTIEYDDGKMQLTLCFMYVDRRVVEESSEEWEYELDDIERPLCRDSIIWNSKEITIQKRFVGSFFKLSIPSTPELIMSLKQALSNLETKVYKEYVYEDIE